MATVTHENVFEPHVKRDDDEMTDELKQLMQDIAREAFLILNDMQLASGVIAKKSTDYQNQLILNKTVSSEKSRVAFVDVLAAIDRYHKHISLYHALLATDVCSYQIPMWAYKHLRHQLVIRVIQDIRTVKRCVNGFTRLRDRRKKRGFLMDRWQRELVNFAVLAT